ncbi:zinc finger protein 740 isoform X3 [Perognathus longimembris pacificus]|uniref:zinc finger protein 740 isoform X3 n=1 Tax=Perognathus longimembris pacificus TaxID=214514 RepID=UPI00201982A2|nr:zinc finger protein 740 isoform X3 [Perognathus longimembris pacificus]
MKKISMAQASLLACEGLAGVSLVPTAASKKMMLSQIASKQAENGERAGSPDVLRCSSQGHRKDSDKSRSRKDDDSLAEASHSKKTVKKVRNHLSVTYVICASSRNTTWNATSVYTVVKSLTSVNGVISVFLGQIDYSDTNGCAKAASPRLLMGSFHYRCKGPWVVGIIRRIH